MRQNILKLILCLTIVCFYTSLGWAQANKTQFATFHGFEHKNTNNIAQQLLTSAPWQWGKIMTVDNQCVPSSAPWYQRSIWGNCEGSFDPIQVTPGTHILSVSSAYNYGFMQGPYDAEVQFRVTFSAGHHYFLNGSIVAERYIKLWVEDEHGRIVTNVVTAFGNYHNEAMLLPPVYTKIK